MTVVDSAKKAAPKVAGINNCCKKAKNLWREFTDPFASVDRCLICGKRHYRAVMSGLEIGVTKR